MKNFFVILKGDFEANIIIRLLQKYNEEYLVVEREDWNKFDQWSDQVRYQIFKKLGERYKVYFVKFPIEVSGGDMLKDVKVISLRDGEECKETALKQVADIIDCWLTPFEWLVSMNQADYIFGMNEFIDSKRNTYLKKYQYESLMKMRDNVLRGEQIAQGITRRELSIAKVAVENKKEYYGNSSRSLTVISLPMDNNGPVMDILFSEDSYGYDILLIRMQSGQLIFSPYQELTDKIQEKIQELGEESWTTRREISTKDRIYIKDTEIDIEKVIRDYIVS